MSLCFFFQISTVLHPLGVHCTGGGQHAGVFVDPGKHIHTLFFHCIMQQEISWFDVTETAELDTRLAEWVTEKSNAPSSYSTCKSNLNDRVDMMIAWIVFGLECNEPWNS